MDDCASSGAAPAASANGVFAPPTWHNIFKFNNQVVEVPVPSAKHGSGPNLQHPLVLTLKGPRGNLEVAHAKGKAQMGGKLTDKLAVAKVALSDLHVLQKGHVRGESEPPSAPLHAWFKVYSPKTDRPVGQLRLTLQLMTVAETVAVAADEAAMGAPLLKASKASKAASAATRASAAAAAAQHQQRLQQQAAALTRFQLVTPGRTWVLATERPEDADRWLEHLRAVVAVLRQGRPNTSTGTH